jgi:hypothetical protein
VSGEQWACHHSGLLPLNYKLVETDEADEADRAVKADEAGEADEWFGIWMDLCEWATLGTLLPSPFSLLPSPFSLLPSPFSRLPSPDPVT